MRIRNLPGAAVAAAISAFVFSAAFSPAEASPIVLDNFSLPFTVSGTAIGNESFLTSAETIPGTFGGFTDREQAIYYLQSSPRGTRTGSAISTGTTGLLQLTNSGTGTGVTSPNNAYAYFGYDSNSVVNLSAGGNNSFSVQTLATSSTPGSSFVGYMEVSTGGGAQTARVTLGSMWAPNTSTSIPFSSFTAVNPNVDFTAVDFVYVGITNRNTLAGSTAYNATANFAAISVVPEPTTQLGSLAGIGAAYGAWRLRKARRARRGCSGLTA